MSVQTNVRSAHRTTTGTLLSIRALVKSVVITTTAVAGSVELRDGGASGELMLTVVTPAVVGLSEISIPGEGVLFVNENVHVTLTAVTAVTVFHG